MAARDSLSEHREVSPVLVRAALDRILVNSAFATSATLCRLLRFLVEETLSGNGPRLKEYVIGSQVLGRGPEFDPRLDPIVRVQARALRARLAQYYASGGGSDAVRIELPKGTYVPAFRCDAPVPSPAVRRKWLQGAAAASFLVVMAAGALLWLRWEHDAQAGEPSVAVLPFSDLSPAHDQQYFSDGLSEELVGALTQAGGMRVIARGQSAAYRDSRGDLREAGRRLRAAGVVAGSVRKEGDRIRIAIQLVDVRDGRYLWAHSYDRQMTDVLAVQEEISKSVLAAMRTNFACRSCARKSAMPPEARELYLQGRYLYNKQTEEALRRSIGYFERAIVADEAYAPAHSGLADSWNLLVQYGAVSPRDGMPKAKAEAQRALALDPALPDAHLSLATILEAYDWDWAAAEREYRRAIELGPDSAPAQCWYGMFLRDRGRLDEAKPYLERGYQLDPVSILATVNLAALYSLQKRDAAAIELVRKAVELEPQASRLHLKLAKLYQSVSKPEEAAAELEQARQFTDSDPHELAGLAASLARRGDKAEARQLLARLECLSRTRYVSSFDLAGIHAALGEAGDAVELLEQAYEERSTGIIFLRWGLFDGLRGDPRFGMLLRKVQGLG